MIAATRLFLGWVKRQYPKQLLLHWPDGCRRKMLERYSHSRMRSKRDAVKLLREAGTLAGSLKKSLQSSSTGSEVSLPN